MSEYCVCGHDQHDHSGLAAQTCRKCRTCVGFRVASDIPMPPQVEAQRRTPDVVAREVRKFALDQAIKSLPHIVITQGVNVVDVATEFEDYILNGKEDK